MESAAHAVYELATRFVSKPEMRNLVWRDAPFVMIVLGIVLIVAERGWSDYRRRKNEIAKINLEKIR